MLITIISISLTKVFEFLISKLYLNIEIQKHIHHSTLEYLQENRPIRSY